MPYVLLGQVALVWLIIQYVRSPKVPGRWKYLVCGVVAVTFLAFWVWPSMFIPAALLQLAIGIYLAIRRLVVSSDPKPPLARPS